MKFLHTSDWHIGRILYGRKRYEECEAFLNWLIELIQKERVDALLVAGDIFENSTPSNRAQELYYRFLHRIAGSFCRHVVITAGNHDSPSFLNAPKELLHFLNVHVIGCVSDSPAEEVLVLPDVSGTPELIICAVPYLRDRDIRTAEAGESLADKERKLVEGIGRHYHEVCAIAEQTRSGMKRSVPIVAMGHLFTAGARTVNGDGVRELYVGSLAHVRADIFPPCIDYLALGHLHMSQKVSNSEIMRYSGSPLPMGFGEAKQEKNVLLVELCDSAPVIIPVAVPRFQELESVGGNWETICERLNDLRNAGSTAWLELIYEGREIMGNIRERLDESIAGTGMEILCIKNNRVLEQAMSGVSSGETLDNLDINEVFTRCMDANHVPDEQRTDLLSAYLEAAASIYQDDVMAE